MKDHGLLFTDAMVRAYLEGRKTQSRRPIRWAYNQVGEPADHLCQIGPTGRWTVWWGQGNQEACRRLTDLVYRENDGFRQPCHAGDRLWVREAARLSSASGFGGVTDTVRLCYRARNDLLSPTHHRPDWRPYAAARWTPSMSMPRWAARLVLPIVSVRVERVRNITDEDASAEGVWPPDEPYQGVGDLPSDRYRTLWQALYSSKYPWDSAWCWVIETEPFKGATR